jgi:hypothetical protein
MSPEMHHLVRRLFDETLERPEAERMPFLESACAGDPEVFRQVAQLVAAHADAGHFLEGEPPRPQRIGRYVISARTGPGSDGHRLRSHRSADWARGCRKGHSPATLADGAEAAFLAGAALPRGALGRRPVSSRHCVVILDVGQEGDVPFIAMEYVEGPSLSQLLAARPKIGRGEALGRSCSRPPRLWTSRTAHGVVHRDIKPANIMLEKGVTVKVADFGIAKIASAGQYTKPAPMGTPSYMSPEQLDAKPWTASRINSRWRWWHTNC